MTRTGVKAVFLLVLAGAFLGGLLAGLATAQEAESVESSTMKTRQTLGMEQYMEELVDNFLIILDASGSKFLPYQQQTKLKVAKDIARRFNKHVPDRPLIGGLRRYGYEAGAFTEPTKLIYGMGDYNRQAYANAIEIIRWAGGKSPMTLAINKASDDMINTVGYAALVIISDGKIFKRDPNPIEAARRMKERYGDRLCIYTVVVGDDFPFDERYHNKMELMEGIARAGECGYMVTADDLIPEENMAKFADDVFTRRHRFRPRKPPEPCIDRDQDGVCDDVDACPNTPRGAKVDERGCWILGRVQFDLNKWNIRPEYFEMLNEIAHVLRINPDVALEVQGHTCTIWTEEYNMKLSHWRAMAVQGYLTDHGARPKQLVVRGYGFHKPTAPNTTEEGRIANRRVEFKRIR